MKPPSMFMAGFIAVVLLALFSVVLLAPTFTDASFDDAMKNTLQTFLTIAIGFYLGSSNSSAKKDETIASMTPPGPSGKPEDPVATKEVK